MSDIVYTFSRKELLLDGLRRIMRHRETIMVMAMFLVLAVTFWIRDGFNYYSLAAAALIPLLPLVHLYWINRIIQSNPLFGS
ncbi:MAG: hypothetical protein ACYTEL_12435 [Planctomycetota bacterium]|jgi:hypothetical protein